MKQHLREAHQRFLRLNCSASEISCERGTPRPCASESARLIEAFRVPRSTMRIILTSTSARSLNFSCVMDLACLCCRNTAPNAFAKSRLSIRPSSQAQAQCCQGTIVPLEYGRHSSMQSDSKLLPKFGEAVCSCETCGNNIIFPIHGDGERINCPHCNKPTTLKGLKLQEFVPDHLRHPRGLPPNWSFHRKFSRLKKALSRGIVLPRLWPKWDSGVAKAGNVVGKVAETTTSGFFDFTKIVMPFAGIFCLILAPFTCGLSLLVWIALAAVFGGMSAQYDETKK